MSNLNSNVTYLDGDQQGDQDDQPDEDVVKGVEPTRGAGPAGGWWLVQRDQKF